ncbi:tyrosine-type recombinase/integrase [Marinobacterium sedimentorum]|uniref:tyrosine-type recombinase/integrase n=1 Tax=Marinobacterium sedimentorum TaxID=2927804 RepID=UPI0020C7027C|nr:site-specific integrase [Marinobacterium sedimentorum]MCP8685967.1 site-specific integrase [Marinobacterium sedimentorum]
MADIRKRTGKKGITYQVRYPCPSTKSGYSFKTFNTMKEARTFTENLGSLAEKSGKEDKAVTEAIDDWLRICATEGRGGRDPVTAYTYENYVYLSNIMKAFSWEAPLGDLSSTEIVEFRSWLLKTQSRYLARKTLSCFQAVLNEMCLRGYVTSNVATGITVKGSTRYKKPIEIPTFDEIMELLAAADRLANSKNRQIARTWERYRPMVYLAVDSGMRPQEYLALAGANILDNGVQVERAVERNGVLSVPKTPASRRFIDISPDVLDMVRHYRDHHAAPNKYDLVFPTESGRWQTVDNWRKLCFRSLSKEAGLMETVTESGREYERPKYNPYALRHFYASILIEERCNLKRIQTLMGHSNISTTFDVYGHLIEKVEQAQKGSTGMLARNRNQK